MFESHEETDMNQMKQENAFCYKGITERLYTDDHPEIISWADFFTSMLQSRKKYMI